MVTISKVFTILCLLCLCLCGNREYRDSFQNKLVSSIFKSVPNKMKGKTFLEWASIDLSSKL